MWASKAAFQAARPCRRGSSNAGKTEGQCTVALKQKRTSWAFLDRRIYDRPLRKTRSPRKEVGVNHFKGILCEQPCLGECADFSAKSGQPPGYNQAELQEQSSQAQARVYRGSTRRRARPSPGKPRFESTCLHNVPTEYTKETSYASVDYDSQARAKRSHLALFNGPEKHFLTTHQKAVSFASKE